MNDYATHSQAIRRAIGRAPRTFTVQGNPQASPGPGDPTGGQTFVGSIAPAPPIDPTMELGSDLRELSIITVHSDDQPPILYSNRITDDAGNNWKVVKRENNPSDFVTRFWVMAELEEDRQ